MTSRTRTVVLAVSVPVIAFAVIGGFLGQAMTRDDAYKHLAVFEDAISIVLNNYVEEVDVSKAMRGAMHGLSEALDADSAYLPPTLAKTLSSNEIPGPADVGIELIRQYYLRVVSVRDGSPAAKAGIRTGDFVRVINGRATRNMPGLEGMRLLRGAAGSKVTLSVIRGNAAEPHSVDLVRERQSAPDITSRALSSSVAYIRVAEFSTNTAQTLKQSIDKLGKVGATKFIVDLRGTSRGDLDDGVAAARLFVKTGTVAFRQAKNTDREVISAQGTDGGIVAPLVLLTDTGTAGAAEVFAAALEANKRSTRVGERTLGRVAKQRLVKLPDGSALWVSYLRYLTPAGEQLHERGLKPDVAVDEPDVEFGAPPPTTDATLEKAIAIATLTDKKAA